MGPRILVAVSEPVLRRAATAELIAQYDVLHGYGYPHALGLILGCSDLACVIAQDRAWDGLDGPALLVVARRRRPGAGRILLVPMVAGQRTVPVASAHGVCWIPWEVGELAATVRRASVVGRAEVLRSS